MTEWVTTKEACERLKVHPNTLRRWDRQGGIETMRTPGGNRLYNLASVEIEKATRYVYQSEDEIILQAIEILQRRLLHND